MNEVARNVRWCQQHGNSLVVAIPPYFRRLLKLGKGVPVLWTNPERGKIAIQNVQVQMDKVGRE